MPDPVAGYSADRSTWAANFFSRLNRYRNLLRRRWWIPMIIITIAVSVRAAMIWFTPPFFTSVGRMVVSSKVAIPENSLFSDEMANFYGTQAALMQSAKVINRAQVRVANQKPNLGEKTASLGVQVLPKTSIFVLRATSDDATYAQAFLQACMEEYIQLKREMRAGATDTTLAGLTEEALRQERDLRTAEEQLAAFQSTNSVVVIQEQGNAAGSRLASLTSRLADLKSEYQLLENLTLEQNLERERQKLAALPKVEGVAPAPAGAAGGTAPETVDEDYFRAKQQISMLKAEIENLAKVLKPKHPKMINLTEELARRERLLTIYRDQSSEKLENNKKSLAIQIKNLEAEVKEWDAKNLEISRKMADYQKLKANVARVQALYERLLDTTKTLDVGKTLIAEAITILEPASAAASQRPTFTRNLLIAALAGLGLSLAILLLLDKLDDRLNSFTELEQAFDEPVLGQIPHEKAPGRRRMVTLLQPDDPRHSFVEAYRNLRSSLLYLSVEGDKPRRILVTSSVPNDGKSLTAANLAITMASAGSKVLLVDADLRKGVVDGRFGVPGEPGLSEVLGQGVNWTATIQPTSVPNLSVLPRGSATHRSAELFLGAAMGNFLEEVVEKFDYILLDSAPVMAADDVTSLAPRVDGVIFVIRAEQTSGRVARAALELLYQRQTRIFGLIFNGVRTRSGDYYYYYKYKDYYRRYPSSATVKS